MLTILKICVIMICISATWAQDNGSPVNPEAIPAVQVQDITSTAAQSKPSQPPKQEQKLEQIETSPKIEQKPINNQESKASISVEEQPIISKQQKAKQEPTVVETIIDDTPNIKIEENKIEQEVIKEIQQESIIVQQATEVKATSPEQIQKQQPQDIGSLQNLTQQQQKQMLLQQSLRAQLHENKQLNLADLANLSPQQQKKMQERFAEEARIAHERAMKQIAERQAKQRQQMQRLLRQTKLSYSQKIKGQQRLKRLQFMKKASSDFQRDSSQVMFQLDPFTEEDFLLTLLVQQEITFSVSIFSNEDGVYTRRQNIENEKPMKISIYQNYNRLIYQDSFYFTNAYTFKGQKQSTYTIRFQNSDIHRLVSAKISNVLSTLNLKSAIKTQDVTIHAQKTNQIWTSLKNKFRQIGTSQTIQLSNKKQLRERIQYYFYYNIVELVIFSIVVFVQIKLIKRLLNRSSVV